MRAMRHDRSIIWVGRSSKIGQTFSLFQGSLQHDRQHRLPNKVDWFIGQKCRPCRFIQVSR